MQRDLICDLWSVSDFGQGKKSRQRDLIGGLCTVSDLRQYMSLTAESRGKLWMDETPLTFSFIIILLNIQALRPTTLLRKLLWICYILNIYMRFNRWFVISLRFWTKKKPMHRDLICDFCSVSDFGQWKNIKATGFDMWFENSLRCWIRKKCWLLDLIGGLCTVPDLWQGMSFPAELRWKFWNIRLYSFWYHLYVLRVSL